MKAAILLACVAWAAAGCLSSEADSEGKSPVRIDGYGLHLLAPTGWDGRVSWPGPGYAVTLEATTADLPPAGSWVTAEDLEDGDAYIAVDDIGPPPPGIGREAAWEVDPPTPLAITQADIQGPFKGGFTSGASLNVVMEGRSLMIRVRFGSSPASGEIAEVNELLESLTVAPRSRR